MPRQTVTAGLVLSAIIASFVLGGLLGQHFTREKQVRARMKERIVTQVDAGNRLADGLSALHSGGESAARGSLEGMLYDYAFEVDGALRSPTEWSFRQRADAGKFLTKAGELYWQYPPLKQSRPAGELEAIFAPYRPAGSSATSPSAVPPR